MSNDDKFIHDLNDSQDFDERLDDLLANPDSSNDELARLIDTVQGIEPPAEFVANLDARLQAQYARRRNIIRLVRYSAAAAAVLAVILAIVLLNDDDNLPQTSGATEVALDFTTTPVETAMAALSTTTALPAETATGTPTSTLTGTATPPPTVTNMGTALPTFDATSTAAFFPTSTLPPAHATQTINMTRVIDDNAEFEDYIDYRATVADVEGLDVEPRYIIQVISSLGTPVPGAIINVANIQLRTNIDGSAYWFPGAYGLEESSYLTTVQDGENITGLVLDDEDETVELTLDAEQDNMPLDVALWIKESDIRRTVDDISVPGADIRIIEDLDELIEPPQLIILTAGSSPEPIVNYPDFLLDLPGVKIQTLAAAVGLDPETEFVWRQIAQFTGGRFIAYDPPFVLPDLITNLIEEEIPQ